MIRTSDGSTWNTLFRPEDSEGILSCIRGTRNGGLTWGRTRHLDIRRGTCLSWLCGEVSQYAAHQCNEK